jgi:hypothetical protein
MAADKKQRRCDPSNTRQRVEYFARNDPLYTSHMIYKRKEYLQSTMMNEVKRRGGVG